ncbi:MAG: hypothetical protein M0C28_45860 [Candidatus Moduliflexus flocculans]|nr:hypothetical protein [Candidatus Moduliflexus flocculans]
MKKTLIIAASVIADRCRRLRPGGAGPDARRAPRRSRTRNTPTNPSPA